MKWTAKSLFVLTFLVLPFVAFSAVRIGISIPIFTGPAGPPIYVPARPVPVGTWENISLYGVIVASSGNSVSVRTPEGFQHNVYFTSQTVVQGRLAYGVAVNVQAQLANGSLYATMISAAGEASPNTYTQGTYPLGTAPPMVNSNSPINGGPPPAPLNVPPPPPNGRAFFGSITQTYSNFIQIQLANGKAKQIFTNPQTQVYGPLAVGTPVIINAVKANGKWVALAIYVSPPPSAYGNPAPPALSGAPYPNAVYIPYSAPYPYAYPVYIYPGYVWPSAYIYGHWGWGGWSWGVWGHGVWVHGGHEHGHGRRH